MHLFENELEEIYQAETALVKVLPMMIENSTSNELIDALNLHLVETKEQVTHLEEVFLTFGKDAAAEKCGAISRLIQEAETIIRESEHSSNIESGAKCDTPRIELNEISSTHISPQFAEMFVISEAIRLLKTVLDVDKVKELKLDDDNDDSEPQNNNNKEKS